MKTQLIMMGICLVIGGFIGWTLHPDDKSNEVIANYQKRLEAIQDSVTQVIGVYQLEIDSLKALRPIIITKYRTTKEQISETILKDSANSIPEYRKGLNSLGTIPDDTPNLTFREIGFGALYFNGLLEKIEQLDLSEKISDRRELMVKQWALKYESALGEIELLKMKECEPPSFWYKRFIAYLGVGINYDGKLIAPGLQLGFGIRIN